MITIRKEQSGDEDQIRNLNARAFGRAAEGEIVDALRRACPEYVSLVAVDGDTVLGHVLFTPATIESAEKTLRGMHLAPLAVLPEFQRRGIGSRLTRSGLDEMRKAGHPFVILYGHAAYYPQFGFVRASRYAITSEYDGVPDEAFMILVLRGGEAALKGVSGTARIRPEFAPAAGPPNPSPA